MSEPPIHVDRLTVQEGDRTLLRQVSLTVQPSARVLLTGRNGAGKSTLLAAIAGVRRSESVRLFGQSNQLPAARACLAWCPGGAHLPPSWTAHELLQLRRAQCDPTAVAHLTAALHLGEQRHQSVHSLSAGERQRVALAVALAPAPAIALLDEPLEHLDAQGRAAVLAIVHERPHTTFVIATHRPSDWTGHATHTLQLHNAALEEA